MLLHHHTVHWQRLLSSTLLFAVLHHPTCLGQAGLNEQLLADGLLGSHFGRYGLPAEFDFVVVGGGTAGLTLARRLASNASMSVAVIEAGGFYEFDNSNLTEIPAFNSYYEGTEPGERNPLFDWGQRTAPQTQLHSRQESYQQGKTFGGGSSRNALWYHRSSVSAYQKWADRVGDQSYAWSEFLPFFQKSTNFSPPFTGLRAANATVSYDSSTFPDQGPIQISYPNWANPISSWAALGFQSVGIKSTSGFNLGSLLGYSYIGMAEDSSTQTRSSASTAYLRSALLQTTNLIVYKSSLVQRVNFDREKTARSVLVQTGDITSSVLYNITARKEIIVSAGAFRSPQLLMLSGIGPRSLLAALKIPIISERPGVGQNMWDHPVFGPTYQVDVVTHDSLHVPTFAREAVGSYNHNRTGILTNSGGDFLAFEKLPDDLVPSPTRASLNATFPSDWPDIELLILDGYAGNGYDLSTGTPSGGLNYATPWTALVAPFSRGNVSITSRDARVNPTVSPNWLSDPRDKDIAIAAYKRARMVFRSKAMSPVVNQKEEAFPGNNITTDDEIWNVIRKSALTIWHASATNAMGKSSDPLAVVDSKCRVFGVKGLRVVDVSAFPFLPPGHPMSTVYALAEKIANDILTGLD